MVEQLKEYTEEEQEQLLKAILEAARSGSEAVLHVSHRHGGMALSVDKNTRIRTIDQLLEAAEIDLKKWMPENGTVNKWGVDSKSYEGIEMLFQVKVWGALSGLPRRVRSPPFL